MPFIGEQELRERADQFIRALHQASFQAEIVESAFRDWQAKVSVRYGDTSLGNVLLYYKKNGSFTFGLQELKDKRFNVQIENCWNGSVNTPGTTSNTAEPDEANDDRLAEVEYYYQQLRPYRESTFDFITLTTAIQRAFAALDTTIDTMTYRFDFNHLERLYTELKDRLRQ